MSILKSQIFGGPLIGIYLIGNNLYVLYPPTLLKPILNKFKNIFKVPFYPLTINNSKLLGVYTASNKYGIIVPHIIRDDEIEQLQSNLRDSIQIGALKSLDNAFGNLIVCNDKGAIISGFLKEYKKQIDKLGRQVKAEAKTLARHLASDFYPELSDNFVKKNSDGVAESLLIALYGRDNQVELV